MKQILLLFLLFSLSNSFAQVVKGKVFDENKQPLPGANIYFDGTTIATISDKDGNFTLSFGSKLNSILAISFIGYQTQFLTNFDSNKEIIVYLKVATNSLNEVVIKKDKFTRKQKMQLFREQFLGQTPNARATKIENEDEINFDYDEKTFTIIAYSDNPLIIVNKALGYKINYELVDFETKFSKESIESVDVIRSYYAGLSRFEEINNDEKNLKKRKNSFQGSQLHFFRNLANNVWNKENFVLYKSKLQVNPDDYFTVSDDNGSKKVIITKESKELSTEKIVAEFNLLFNKKQQSRITFETDTFYIDKFGNNSHIENIIFSGHLSHLKVGDMLPINYGIE